MRLARPLFAAVALVALAGPAAAQAPTFTWIGTSSGNWSGGTKWQGSTPPPAGGGATQVLQFNNNSTSLYQANNDLAGTFVLNGLILNAPGGFPTIAGNPLRFVANGP